MPRNDFTSDAEDGVLIFWIVSIFFVSADNPLADILWLANVNVLTENTHFFGLVFSYVFWIMSNTSSNLESWCLWFVPHIITSSLMFLASSQPGNISSIIFWNCSNALLTPYINLLYWYTPLWVVKLMIFLLF